MIFSPQFSNLYTHLNLYSILGKKAWLQKLDFLQKKR